MNLDEIPLSAQTSPNTRPDWQKRFEQWREILAECGRKPGKSRVHALRVATLRLKAELNYWIRPVNGDNGAHQIAARWNKQAGKLRKTLSEVRETDVYLAKLEGLRGSLTEPQAHHLRTNRASLSQLDRLERRLLGLRKAAARKLIRRIANRRQRLLDAGTGLEQALQSLIAPVVRLGSSEIARQFSAVADDFPHLDVDNLHDFRKRIKIVRYLAELFKGQDTAVDRMAVALRRMQRSIGEWHDWDVLAKLADRSLPAKKSAGGLVEMLGTLAVESLAKALGVCEREKLRFTEATADGQSSSPASSPRRPIRSAEPISHSEQRSA